MNPIYTQDFSFKDVQFTLWQRIRILFLSKVDLNFEKAWKEIYDLTIQPLEYQLAECYRLTGADPDGNEDWRLAERAVEAVRELRKDYDCAEDEAVRLMNGPKPKRKKPRKKK